MLQDDDKKRQHSISSHYTALLNLSSLMTALLALNTDTNSIEDRKRPSNPTAAVLGLCEPLVNVVNDQVQFVHASVKDFLLQSLFSRGGSDKFPAGIYLSI
jgi:hypothetical protein